jgi:hypothetical protein
MVARSTIPAEIIRPITVADNESMLRVAIESVGYVAESCRNLR